MAAAGLEAVCGEGACVDKLTCQSIIKYFISLILVYLYSVIHSLVRLSDKRLAVGERAKRLLRRWSGRVLVHRAEHAVHVHFLLDLVIERVAVRVLSVQLHGSQLHVRQES